ncbi:WD repeat-containing protein 76-like [Argiope bruennichi]|uniref:WD repeat-containing protein 76-like n=1 Tax=Argiope bruennichi TaxID=94029 RepID=UPI0024949E8A|nr:WD repeat-containing protein 76-like [Argiope bruennichi]
MKRKSAHKEFEDNIKKVKDEKPDIGNLSEYEKMIQKNRDEKAAFLESLRMDEVKEGLNEAINNLKPKKPPRKNIKSPKSVLAPQVPTRKSLRLAKVDIDLSEKAVEARALAEAEKEIEKVFKIKGGIENFHKLLNRHQRKSDNDTGLMKKKIGKITTKKVAKFNKDTSNSDELPPILPFQEAITGENVYADFARDFDDLDFKTPKPFTDYVSCFKKMKIDESKIAKVVNGRITAMALHPMKEKVIVSAGNKYGAIGFWHVNSDSDPYEFRPHLFGVSCMKFNSDSLNQIMSSSYDGTMRCGDMEKKVFNEVFNISDETSCNYFDFISPTTILVCHRNGKVSIVDIRSDSKSADKSHKCHEYSVKTVSVHPVNKNYFVSADMKGFLSLWDLRKLQKKPVIEVHHHRKVITSAFFSPVTGNSILTTSADDSLCLFNSSKLGSALPLDTKVRHNNFTGRWLSTFKATWLPNIDDAFVIGSMEYPRKIEIFNNQLDSIYNFQDEYLGCITSTNVFHPSLPVLAGGNSSGKVYIFS